MSKDGSFVSVSVPDAVKTALVEFFHGLGRDLDANDDEMDLITSTGASSDEGIDFAIDLSNILAADIPNDFNPFVHPSGRRGMKLRELIEFADRFVTATKEAGHGGR